MVKYLVTSGNASTGRATIHALKALGETDIVAGARDPAKSQEALLAAGATQVVELDLDKPDTIHKALSQGVERILVVSVEDADRNVARTQAVIDAARKYPSVKVIGRISVMGEDANSSFDLIKSHGVATNALQQSGYNWFAINPNFFMDNWIQSVRESQDGNVYGSGGDGKTSYVALEDIGAVVAAALKFPEKFNGRIQVAGPATLTESDVASIISDVISKPIKFVNLPPDQYRKILIDAGVPAKLTEYIVVLDEYKAAGKVAVDSDIKHIIGRDPIDLKTWAQKNKAAFL